MRVAAHGFVLVRGLVVDCYMGGMPVLVLQCMRTFANSRRWQGVLKTASCFHDANKRSLHSPYCPMTQFRTLNHKLQKKIAPEPCKSPGLNHSWNGFAQVADAMQW